MSSRPAYHEALLHWIWENRQFNPRSLHTTGGQPVEIHSPGRCNKSDGPDFKQANLTIGNLRWHGDAEIHWEISDWKQHGHQTDPNFNNVILHVVFAETDHQSRRQDGSDIPTLCLEPQLSQPLQTFLQHYRSQPELPCAGQLSFISEEAFQQQLKKAHKEYFEQKVDDLLEFYDPNLPPSGAWLKMFGVAISDGLGISHNRGPMRRLASKLIGQLPSISSREELQQKAHTFSGIRQQDDSPLSSQWKHKGCRPGNHPEARIRQAADILWHIHQLSFDQWLQEEPEMLWRNLVNAVTITPSLGKERGSILFGTVFLPALYSLGNLFFSTKRKSQSWELWRDHQANIPSSLLKRFHNTDMPAKLYAQKLGAIYQLREYCQPRNCQDCKVFKNAISS